MSSLLRAVGLFLGFGRTLTLDGRVRRAAVCAAEALEARQLLSAFAPAQVQNIWTHVGQRFLDDLAAVEQSNPQFASELSADLAAYGLTAPVPAGASAATATSNARAAHPHHHRPHPHLHVPKGLHRYHKPRRSHASDGRGSSGGPNVTATGFDVSLLPQEPYFSFDSDVHASVSTSALAVTALSTSSAVNITAETYNTSTNTAIFGLNPSAPIPDGNYASILKGSQVTDSSGNHLTGSDGNAGDNYQYNFFFYDGDLNSSRTIDFTDLLTLAQHYNQQGNYTQGDTNYDGTINSTDLDFLSQRYGTSLPLLGQATGLMATSVSSTSVQIAWTPATDANVSAYDVYRDGVRVAAGVDGPTYTDFGLSPNSKYAYTVVSRDSASDSSYPTPELVLATARTGSAPVVQPIAPLNAVEGSSVFVSTDFTDADPGDTHQATFAWGDGAADPGYISPDGQSGTVSAAHTYGGGLFHAALTITDTGGAYAVVPFTVAAVPIAPSNLVATPLSDSSIGLAWQNNSPSETSFTILVYTDDPDSGGPGFTYLDDVPGNQPTYTATGLDAEASYTFEVVANNAGGSSSPSNAAAATTFPVVAPTGLTADPESDTKINLTWTDNSDDENGFYLEWSTDDSTFSELTSVAADTTTYEAGAYVPGTQYYFRVQAVATAGASDWSETANAATDPPTPTGLSGTEDSSGDVSIKWNLAAGAEWYLLERSDNGGAWEPLGGGEVSGTDWYDSDVSSGHTYQYRVTANNGNRASGTSVSASVTVLPEAPSGVSVNKGDDPDHLKLTWTDNSSGSDEETGFKIEKSTDGINFQPLDTVGADTTTYTTTAPTDATPVTYRVCAYNDGGNSAWAYADYNPNEHDINFDDLAAGTTVTNQYTVATFSADAGYSPEVEPNGGLGTTGNTLGVEPPNAWPQNYNQNLYLDFSTPVQNLTFDVLADDDSGNVGQVRVYQNGAYTNVEDIEGDGNPYSPIVMDLSAYQNVTRIEVVDITDRQGFWYDDFKFDVPPQISLAAHRTGLNSGQPVDTAVQQAGDPTQYVILTNNDYQEHPDLSQPDDADTTALIQGDQLVPGPDGSLDTDLAKITLHSLNLPSGQHTGKVKITLSDPTSARLFDQNGQMINASDMTVDLSSPSGPLAAIANSDVDVWLEGLHKDSDFVFKVSYEDSNGNETSRDTVHLLIADWNFIGKDGSDITSVDRDSEQLLLDDQSGDPNAPQAADSVYYKINIDGLPTSAVQSLTVTSDSVSDDSYTDDFPSSDTETQSSDWAALYTQPDGGDDLSVQQVSDLKQHMDLNVLHNPGAMAKLTMTGGTFARRVAGKPFSYTTQNLYDWLTTDPSYGPQVQFLLDQMKQPTLIKEWPVGGQTPAFTFAVQPLAFGRRFDGTNAGAWVNSNAPDQATAKAWALDALREFAADQTNVLARDAYDFQGNFFGLLAREWARHFYWDDSNPSNPVVLARPDPNAPVTALASTLDFLYLFSADAAGEDQNDEMYGAAAGAHWLQDDLPNIYIWVFADRGSFSPFNSTDAKVNIPSLIGDINTPSTWGGLNSDYWEWDTTHPVHGWMPAPWDHPVAAGPAAGSWPMEDQTHHFAGYFYLGAVHGANNGLMGNTSPLFFNLVYALKQTADYPGPVGPKPAAVPPNKGDYYLGVVAADLGADYRLSPYSFGGAMGRGGAIANRLHINYQGARTIAGRTTDP